MKHQIRFLIAVIIMAAFTFTQADVILDHFEDFYAANPEQCHLGEAYGYSLTKPNQEIVDTGNGWWSPFIDDMGSLVTNGEQVSVDSLNSGTIVEEKAMHIFFKTHLSNATQSGDSWAFAGIYCDLMMDSLTYFDFTDLTEITMKLKGRGKIRVLFQTKDVYEMVDSNGVLVEWGYYGFDIIMDSTYDDWKEETIPAVLLDPEAYSPAADSLWKWAPPDSGAVPGNTGRKFVKGFVIQACPDDDTTSKDSVNLYVDDIVFIGLDYQNTFGFEYDTNVAIIYIPQNNVKMNVNITPNYNQKAINISYELTKNSDVFIAIYDLKGKIISELVNARQNSGTHRMTAEFNTREMNSGVYFITFKIGEAAFTRKFSFIK